MFVAPKTISLLNSICHSGGILGRSFGETLGNFYKSNQYLFLLWSNTYAKKAKHLFIRHLCGFASTIKPIRFGKNLSS